MMCPLYVADAAAYDHWQELTQRILSLFLSQISDGFSGIADAVLRACLTALGMPSNALASFLDDPEPTPNMGPASLLQAISYSGELLCCTQACVAVMHAWQNGMVLLICCMLWMCMKGRVLWAVHTASQLAAMGLYGEVQAMSP